jgi:protein TonB
MRHHPTRDALRASCAPMTQAGAHGACAAHAAVSIGVHSAAMAQSATNTPSARRHRCAWALGLAVLVAGCATPPPPEPARPVAQPRPPRVVTPVLPKPPPARAPEPSGPVSVATSPRAYRVDAASHLYARNAERIFKGQLPPLLYAIGVLEVEIDAVGRVADLRWMRAPKHAPEVVAEIERSVHAAAPYPAPVRMGRVTYTDTWLWHKSGRFQLDTLTEGQR